MIDFTTRDSLGSAKAILHDHLTDWLRLYGFTSLIGQSPSLQEVFVILMMHFLLIYSRQTENRDGMVRAFALNMHVLLGTPSTLQALDASISATTTFTSATSETEILPRSLHKVS